MVSKSSFINAIRKEKKKTRQPKVFFIIVGGDRDFKPCIEQAAKSGFAVEIVAWKNGLSNDLKFLEDEKFANGEKLVTIRYLEDIVWDNVKPLCWRIEKRWNPQEKRIPRERSIVHIFRQSQDHGKVLELVDAVTAFLQFPCQGYWLNEERTKVVVIIMTPEKVKSISNYEFSAEFSRWRESDAIKAFDVQQLATAFEFFGPDGDDGYQVEGEDEDVTESGSASGYCLVPTGKKPKRLSSSDPCRKKFACDKRGSCGWTHSKDEMRYFHEHGTHTYNYKSKPCLSNPCKYKGDSVLCPYAHNENEARCYECNSIGHFADTCPNRE